MRILRGLYHFLLFLLVSWTVYNTFIFVCLLLPASDNEFAELNIFDAWNFYLLGALDFHDFITQLSHILGWLDLRDLRDFWHLLILIYVFFVNGLAAYIWRYNQNPLGAAFLALAPCIAGPHLALLRLDYMILIYGMGGILVFYGTLSVLNGYRKKRWPWLSLPAWLEWRRPNMLPSLKSVAHKMERMFRKSSS